jgi:hypothetical protein
LSVPAVAAVARDSRLTELAAEVLGCDPVPFGATLFDKSSEANWLVVWHQDTALPLIERRDAAGWGPWSTKGGITYAHAPASALSQVVALRVHLDASAEDNGPLRVLPGTHNLGVLTDQQIHSAAARIEPVTCTGSTPFPRTVELRLRTSDRAGRLYDAFAGCGTARGSRTDPLVPRRASDTGDGSRVRV